MDYAIVGIIAVIVHIVVNIDLFTPGKHSDSAKYYRYFLISVIVFSLIDISWGLTDEYHSVIGLNIATFLFFATMAFVLAFWARFTIKYLGKINVFAHILTWVAIIFFVYQIAVLIVNLFTPILYQVDADGAYKTLPLRYVTFGSQVIVFLLLSIYATIAAFRNDGANKRHHFTITAFGITMIIAGSLQYAFPMLPLYTIGYLIGGCILHTFLVNDEMKERELQLLKANYLAFTDSLTGVKSKHAYVSDEQEIDEMIAEGSIAPFAVVFFDLNDLKTINDTLGHEVGDEYIRQATKMICAVFSHSPVYRIGGDEFIAILQGEDFENREGLFQLFNSRIDQNKKDGKAVVAAGYADYIPGDDDAFTDVLFRADKKMYERKTVLKK